MVGHSHAHHEHHRPAASYGRAFALSIGLNLAIVLSQLIYGWLANSTALIADAGHNFSDVLGLILAWGAIWLAKKQPNPRYTFGLRGASILAALANAVLLLGASGWIVWEAVPRFMHPAPVAGATVFIVATVGAVINGFSAWLLMSGSRHDLNIRSAFLHMVGDAAISLAVAISGLIILWTGWHWVDPALSIGVVLLIVYSTWGLLRASLQLALGAVPANVNLLHIEHYLAGLPGVVNVCDLHVWALSTTENALTAHLSMPAGHPGDDFLTAVTQTLAHEYSIHHVTLQINLDNTMRVCALTSPEALS
ncbi:MAG: cobalt-zinc-cadmium efflux system protein [Glomeribacter sp. 1016415]|nr:cobalt-zinc-cadmium efflux system protein [Glomeribacter sp. 1016415]